MERKSEVKEASSLKLSIINEINVMMSLVHESIIRFR